MAFPVATDVETPEVTVVSEYTVYRMGVIPSVKIVYRECMRVMDSFETGATFDAGSDGMYESVDIPSMIGRDDLIGRTLERADGLVLGEIESISETGLVMFEDPINVNVGNSVVFMESRSPLGTAVHRPANGGRQWVLQLQGGSEEGLAMLGQIMGGVYFAAVKTAMVAMGLPVDDEVLAGTIQALAAQGTNIDSFLTLQAEALEQARLSGFSALTVMGDAPRTS